MPMVRGSSRLSIAARALGALALLGSMTYAASALGEAWTPDRNIELVIPASAGGGLDRTARAMQKVLQDDKLAPVPVVIVNKPGGGGTIAYNYLQQRAGRGEALAVASTSLLTNHITGKSQITYTDFTPVALLSSEYLCIVVKPGSPLGDVSRLLAKVRSDSGSASFGIASTLGNHQHVLVSLLGKAAGADVKSLKVVVFNASTDAMSSVMGGHIDASTSTVGNVRGLVDGGQLRMVAVAAPKRFGDSLADVPTFKESGVNAVVDSWRALIGPANMTQAQLAWWDKTLAAAMQNSVWETEAKRTMQENNYKNSAQTKQFLAEQYAEFNGILHEIGVARR